MSRFVFTIALTTCFLFAQTRGGLAAQTNAAQNPQTREYAAKVKQKVEKLQSAKTVTVRLIDGRRFRGSIQSIADEQFSLAEQRTKQLIDIRYDQVQRIERISGETKANLIRIGAGVTLVVLIVITIAALKKS